MKEQMSKGPAAEESLRNYFLSIGYFVVRGCKFRFEQFDVTDIDLWLYGKSSAISRERLNVDIKNRRIPQALERIFWTRGLQNVLGFDACVVATTDTRKDVLSFGLLHGVKVLDGGFLSRLMKSDRSHQDRIPEEQLLAEMEQHSLGKMGGDWRGRYETSKSRLLDSLSFDGCNAWLNDIKYFLDQALQFEHQQASVCWRLVYLTTANLLIAIDFILREHVAADQEQRHQILAGGFRYGSAGKAYTEKVGNLAAALVEGVVSQPGLGKTVQQVLNDQASGVKAEVLAEYLAKGRIPSTLFDTAKELEASAFSRNLLLPTALSTAIQSVLGVISDFHGFDRKRVLI